MQSELQYETIPDIPVSIHNSLNKLHNQSGGQYSYILRVTETKALCYLYCTTLQNLMRTIKKQCTIVCHYP